jgi:hypothetical protein
MIFRHALFISLVFTCAACFGADTKNLHQRTSAAPFIVFINHEDFRGGLEVELEYRLAFSAANVTNVRRKESGLWQSSPFRMRASKNHRQTKQSPPGMRECARARRR